MLTLERKDAKLMIMIDSGLAHPDGGSTSLALEWNCGQTYYAHAVVNHVRDRLSEAMRAVRRDAYAQGWSDAESKRAKCNHFSSRLP